jgi:LmbE family N-acetylglucosaminyl deacetylase
MTPNQESIDIVAFGAHPDDVELSAGGTIAKAVSEGKSVVLVDLTKGEMGSRGTPEIRLEEAKAAARHYGLKYKGESAQGDSNIKDIPTSSCLCECPHRS